MTTFRLSEISQLIDGQLHGDGQKEITGAAILRDATVGDITFADEARLLDQLNDSNAAAAIVSRGLQPSNLPFIVVDDVRTAFTTIVQRIRPPIPLGRSGISPTAHVSANARLENDVHVHAGATIGDGVHLGRGCIIHSGVRILAGCRLAEHVVVFPNAVLYENTVIGRNSIIHAGAVIGCYGFGYDTVNGKHNLGPQLGNVELGAEVHIGAATTIDRGTYGPTTIGDGTKIDNQVMIGHNCRIGRHNLLCSQVGIAGSVSTGDYVVMAGKVGIRDHVRIADHVILGARSGVGQDITEPGSYFGAPARPDREQLQILFAQQKVPAMRRQLKDLQRAVDRLLGDHAKETEKDAA